MRKKGRKKWGSKFPFQGDGFAEPAVWLAPLFSLKGARRMRQNFLASIDVHGIEVSHVGGEISITLEAAVDGQNFTNLGDLTFSRTSLKSWSEGWRSYTPTTTLLKLTDKLLKQAAKELAEFLEKEPEEDES